MTKPKKPKAMRADSELRIPVTAAQKAILLRAMRRTSFVTIAAWARFVLLDEADKTN